MVKKTIDIMGNEWVIHEKTYEEDPTFEVMQVGGFCEMADHSISVCNMRTFPGYELESKSYIVNLNKSILRHEIIHAYLYESGLATSTHSSQGPWAMDEEIIDWIAIQSPKFLKTFKTLNII